MILVAAPFMLVLIGMCVSLMMELRKETVRLDAAEPGAAGGRARQRYPDGP